MSGRRATRFAGAVERAFGAAKARTKARAGLTALAIFLIFASVVGILWYGAQDVLAGTMTGGRLGQFVLYAVFAAAATGELSEVWGEINQAAGAAERLGELLAVQSAIKSPPRPVPLPEPPRGEIAFRDVIVPLPLAAGDQRAERACRSGRSPVSAWPSSVPQAPARPRSLRFCSASTIRKRER